MNKISFLFAALCFLSLAAVISACKKSSPKSKTEQISRTWQVQKAEENRATVYTAGATQNSVNYSSFRFSFNNPGFIFTDNTGNSTSGTWAFEPNNESIIKLTVVGNPNFKPGTLSIVTLDDNNLVIRFTMPNNKGQNTEYTITMIPFG